MKNTAIQIYRWGGVFLSSILAATVLTLFSACDSPSSSWEEPVRDYFDKYTNTAAIEKQEISFQTQKDNSGTTCIPSDGNKTVTFYLRNPRLYTLETSFSEPDTYPDIQIVQDTQDKTIIRLTYSQDYLLAHEGGQQIGGTIYLTESETLREFDPYSFSLKCNTPPPGVKGATVQKDDTNKHVVCFYLPTDQLSSPRHQNEAHTLYIGKTAISLGTQASMLSSANTTRPSPLYPAKDGGPSFSTTPPPGYTPFYYTTNHSVAEGDTSWKIKIVDENGFSSYEATASTATTAQPLTLSGDSTVVKGQSINITAALPVGVTATSYEVESSTDNIVNTTQSGGTIHVTANNAGTTTLTVTANLPGGQISQATKTIRVIDLTLSDANEEVMFVDGDDITLSATPAGFPSTPTCTWSTSNPSIATVNSSGKVSATGVGTATITASATYDGKTVNATKTVQVCSVSISGENMSLVGSSNTFELTATVSKPAGLTQSPSYEWSSSTGTVASATRDDTDHSKATVTPSASTSGTTDIKVKVTIGTKDFTAKKTVTIYDLKINGNPLIDASGSGTAFTVYANAGSSDYNPPTGMTITWNKGSSTNVTLATSNGGKTCTLTPQSAGSFDLHVNASLSNGKSLTKTKKIYVIGVSGDKNFIEGETPRSLSVTPATGLTYTWQPLNASIADVNTSNGKITAKSGGDASIKLTASLGSDSKTITIPISVYGITISGNPLLKKGGSNTTLTASVKKGSTNYPETLTYEWTSGSTNKATAGKTTGVISPVAAGTSEITLTVKRSGTTVATKKQKVYVIEVSGLTTFVAGEEERKLTVAPASDSDLTYEWTPTSGTYATVNSSTGYIKAKAKGSATITLTVKKGSYSVSVPTTITIHKLTLTGMATEIAVGESYECTYSFDPELSYNTLTCEPNSGNFDTVISSLYSGNKIGFEGKTTGTETFKINITIDGKAITYKLPTITVVSAHEVSISDLNEWLSNQPETNINKPYKLKVTGMTNSSHLTTLASALKSSSNNNKYVDLSATTLPSVSNMEQCFVGCDLMVYPPVIPTGVTNMKSCFGSCSSLKKAPAIPSGVTDMTACFVSCWGLETPPATIPSTVKSMEACFYYCSNLKTPPVISNGVENLFYCFEYCSKLESAPEIPASVTNMARCFRYCTLLSGNVTIKANITNKEKWINTFTDCTNIGTVYVKSTSVKNNMKHDTSYDVGISADKIQVSS